MKMRMQVVFWFKNALVYKFFGRRYDFVVEKTGLSTISFPYNDTEYVYFHGSDM